MREIEVEYVVGPVPIDDGWGKEVVVRYEVGIVNNQVWWTDSNGRELQRRVRNARPGWDYVVVEPVASNFVPVNAFAYMADSQRSLAVLPDRSHGCGSIHDGQLEVMLHRRLLHDDYYGVSVSLHRLTATQPPSPSALATSRAAAVCCRCACVR
jgi:hypothetical protein